MNLQTAAEKPEHDLVLILSGWLKVGRRLLELFISYCELAKRWRLSSEWALITVPMQSMDPADLGRQVIAKYIYDKYAWGKTADTGLVGIL